MALDTKIREILKEYDTGAVYRLQIQRTDFRQICAQVTIQALDDSDPTFAVRESIQRLQNYGFTIIHGPVGQKRTFIVCQ